MQRYIRQGHIKKKLISGSKHHHDLLCIEDKNKRVRIKKLIMIYCVLMPKISVKGSKQ